MQIVILILLICIVYHDVKWITLFTFLCFLTAVISSLIVYLIYKNKEKTLIKLEQCGGNI